MTRAEAVAEARQALRLIPWAEEYEPRLRETREGIRLNDPASAGWGVIMPEKVDPRIEAGLERLISHRQKQAEPESGKRFKRMVYRPGETKQQFYKRHGIGPGPLDPDQMPYYLLIVGDPEEIPFSFQYQLGVRYAVGRLCFAEVGDYATYANSVVDAETRGIRRSREAALFGVHNHDDWITGVCTENLVRPVAEKLTADRPDWRISTFLERAASKDRLAQLIGDEAPALLFTASHAACFKPGDRRIFDQQGALVCDEWPGPEAVPNHVCREHIFAAEDVTDQARLHGVICFHLSCFSAGTPEIDSFGHGQRRPRQLSDRSFVAALPQRLMSHEGGGALAVIGHVDTAWEHSFLWQGSGQAEVYRAVLNDIMAGRPVGMAAGHLGDRYSEIAADLNDLVDACRETGEEPDEDELVYLWTAHNDARSFVLLGDPAVRLQTRP
jgi:hypothetical protein